MITVNVPCTYCREPTPMTGTKLCNRCWEVDRSLEDFLRAGGTRARKFVERALSRTAKVLQKTKGTEE
jgi:hypothetical protein